jgi:hypothetical protein
MFAPLFIGICLIALTFTANAQKVRLRSQITPSCTATGTVAWKFSDIYADGNIAVQGSYNCRGAFIYDISNPDAPVLSSWYNPGNNQQFLEAIVIGNRGYFGSGNGGGVHIVDLTNPSAPTLLGTVSATSGNGFASIHEMMILRQNGAEYLIENFNGFSSKIIKVINITNPATPVFVRDINPTEAIWVHAMHIRGNRMITSGWGNSANRGRTEIYDISNIGTQAPTLLGFIEDTTTTTNGNNMHSSWTSEDGNYLYSCRETANGLGDLRTYNISNPAQPLLVNRLGMQELGLNAVTPHNPVVLGNKLYIAWYQAGIQVFDLTNPAQPKRIGQYDTFQPQFSPGENAQSLTDEPWDLICGGDNLQNALPTNYNGNWAVFPLLGENKVLAGDMSNGLLVLDATQANAPAKNIVSDFDGDGKTDYSVFTPNSGAWQVESSSTNAFSSTPFGSSGDKIVAGDYDGDGKSDYAVFRPSVGVWYILGSTRGFSAISWGSSADIPVPADYDADGKTDVAVWRPSNGTFYVLQSTLGFTALQWGQNGDKPVVADFEGDGKPDFGVYRAGVWYIMQSSSSILFTLPSGAVPVFGNSTDKPLVADFDGDSKADIAVFRPSDGSWYITKSIDNSLLVYNFGIAEDLPIPADYDGDGKADVSVFRPSANSWYRLSSSSGAFSAKAFGQTGDRPSPVSVQPQ